MQSEVRESAAFLKAWAWVELHLKEVLWGTSAAILVGVVIAFFVWRHGETRVQAGEALSDVFVPEAMAGNAARPESANGYLKVASEYSHYPAGAQGVLLAAGDFFGAGKYDDARLQFERFIREYSDNRLVGQALLGIAACLNAQGKTNEATTAYRALVDQHPTEPCIPQAKYSLACLYQAQGKLDQARNLLEDVARARYGSVSTEAIVRLEELYQSHPELRPAPLTPASGTNAAAPLLRPQPK